MSENNIGFSVQCGGGRLPGKLAYTFVACTLSTALTYFSAFSAYWPKRIDRIEGTYRLIAA